jgi:peptide/nickel transport system substrate-binding protein
MRRFLLAACCALLALAPAAARAQQRTLTIAAQSAPTAMDPHFHRSNSNNAVLRHVFDPLVDFDTAGRIVPRLAESWRAVDDLTWEFRLRENLRFHDGTPLEPEDIAFSFARLPQVPNSPGSFASAVRTVASVTAVDPRTVRITTREPTPFLDAELTSVLILSRRLHEGATTADFNNGRAMVGTGAYRHVSYEQGDRLEVAANPDHWGGRPPWDRVRMRFVSNPGARAAALLAGDVDLIDGVATQDVARLSADPRLAVFGVESNGTAYLFPDAARERAPFVSDRQGRPLDRNPLRDRRVRQALSLAINREGIVERLLAGQGRPAEQFAPPAVVGRAPGMPPLPLDPARARRLLAEAGYPEGFRLTIHGPNGWFPGDAEVLQAIAQGFTRIGVETAVETLPTATFFTRATNRDFALFMTTYASNVAALTLQQVVATRDPAAAMGPFNRQHYSNPAVDGPLSEALRTMDKERRDALTAEAMRAAIEDGAVIPVFYLKNNWAALRARVRYDPHPGWYTNALLATPVD